jgi:hypothetical protein
LPHVCTICELPDRAALEAEAVAGKSKADLARRFNVHRDAIARHLANHPPEGFVVVEVGQQESRAGAAQGSLARLETKLVEVEALQASATKLKHSTAALGAAKQAVALIEQIGRLTGDLTPAAPVAFNPMSTPAVVNVISLVKSFFDQHLSRELRDDFLIRLAALPDDQIVPFAEIAHDY